LFDTLKKLLSSTTKAKDIIKPSKGIFNLEISEEGEIVHTFSDKNMIVDVGFGILAGLVTTGDSNKVIDTIALGSAGIVDNKFVFPTLTDQTLRVETFRKTGCTFNIDTIKKQVEFIFILDKTEGNGGGARLYTEAGLFSHDGTMMARRVFPEAVKTPNQIMTIRWVLSWN